MMGQTVVTDRHAEKSCLRNSDGRVVYSLAPLVCFWLGMFTEVAHWDFKPCIGGLARENGRFSHAVFFQSF